MMSNFFLNILEYFFIIVEATKDILIQIRWESSVVPTGFFIDLCMLIQVASIGICGISLHTNCSSFPSWFFKQIDGTHENRLELIRGHGTHKMLWDS